MEVIDPEHVLHVLVGDLELLPFVSRWAPEKTRLVRFHPPSTSNPEGGEGQRQRSFDLLGFTLYWGRSRKGDLPEFQSIVRELREASAQS